MNDFAIYKDEDRQTYLAYFYERLARWLLHEQIPSPDEWLTHRGMDHFDITHQGLRLFIEVKGSSNIDHLKLFGDQLQFQMEELGFPIDDGAVWIFTYRNQEKEKTRHVSRKGKVAEYQSRLLKKKSGKSWNSLSKFLAEHTIVTHVIDLRLLEMLSRRMGIRPYTRDRFHEREAIRINRGDLNRLAENARAGLVEAGISPADLPRWLPPRAHRIRSRFIDTNLDGNPVSFEIIPILPNGTKIRFLKWLNGNVRKT